MTYNGVLCSSRPPPPQKKMKLPVIKFFNAPPHPLSPGPRAFYLTPNQPILKKIIQRNYQQMKETNGIKRK